MKFRTRSRSWRLWCAIVIGIIGCVMSERPLYALEHEALLTLVRDDLHAVIAQDPELARKQELDGGLKLVFDPASFIPSLESAHRMRVAILLQPVLPKTHPSFIRIHLPVFYQLDMTHQARIVSRPTLALIQQALRDADAARPVRDIAVQKLNELPRFQEWKDHDWLYTIDVYLFGSIPSVKPNQAIVEFDTPGVSDQAVDITIDIKTRKIVSVLTGPF